MVGSSTENKITGDILISEIVENYPLVVDFLVEEYGFHCVTCFISSFETLEEGAKVHGIAGDDFTELLEDANRIATTGPTISN